jgi:BclA C-terminal domain/Collagen triple helix repeat (20 copies)
VASVTGVSILLIAALVFSDPGSATSAVPLAAQDVAAKASVDSGPGYWLVTSTGQVYAYGGATNFGGMTGRTLTKAIVGIASSPDGKGYWLFGADGGVFAFGDAAFYGSRDATGTSNPVVAGASVQNKGTGGSGSPGATGRTGATGPAGAPGAKGDRGLNGLNGANGAEGPIGAPGAMGGMGLTGAPGAAGSPGTKGDTGLTGAPGTTGTDGAAGAAGPAGSAGAVGPQGPAGHPQFGYIYNLTPQTVAIDGAVLFDSNGPLSGFTHTAGSASIAVVSAGIYLVDFSVSGTEPNQFSLFDNATAVAGATYGSGAGTQQNGGQVIVSLAAGAVLTLVNHSSAAAVGLASVIGGTQANVNASVVIEQLG